MYSGVIMASVINYCATYIKDPDAVLDYTLDWSSWLADGETISTSSWTVEAGITEDSDTNTSTNATIWLSGGTDGSSYIVTNRITTSESRTDDRSVKISVCER